VAPVYLTTHHFSSQFFESFGEQSLNPNDFNLNIAIRQKYNIAYNQKRRTAIATKNKLVETIIANIVYTTHIKSLIIAPLLKLGTSHLVGSTVLHKIKTMHA